MKNNGTTPFSYCDPKEMEGSYKVRRKNRKVFLNIVDAPSPTDPLGMYTGIPSDPWEDPIQDADDL